ncbi:MAG: hypothetical protein ACM3ML_34425 [Micromonosporaceae bacterium]
MTDGRSGSVRRPETSRGRWTSFVADAPPPGRPTRELHEQGNPRHRLRVEHDNHTLLIHISDEDGGGWTTVALDRASRAWALAQRDTQRDAASSAYQALYEP